MKYVDISNYFVTNDLIFTLHTLINLEHLIILSFDLHILIYIGAFMYDLIFFNVIL